MLPSEYEVEGKTVIITGAARGIGKGIARVLSESGARVMVTALTERYLGPLAQELAASGHPIETLTADATKAEDWQRTLDAALERWSPGRGSRDRGGSPRARAGCACGSPRGPCPSRPRRCRAAAP